MKIAVAQFQPKDGDKEFNLSVIDKLTERAKSGGADVITFHEMSVTAYTHTKNLDFQEISQLAEIIPFGESTAKLIDISARYNIPVLAGLVEKEDRKIYNTYICVYGRKVIAKYRKLHPFINRYLSAGEEYVVFDLMGWKCGILTCYDNNVIENVRATVLLGAELILAPHVTCCTPSSFPGSGFVADKLWQNRDKDPVSLRSEFDGPKGRGWLMRWLPARAYDNGVYYAFTNPVGYDGDQLKNGNSMILDPYGEILTEIRSFEDDIAIAEITRDKLRLAGGYRYRNARRPDLYREIIGRPHASNTKPIWLDKSN
ncbi:MAG: nitrilase family protein [Bacteroidales bacterium]|nr:nitrilase family protein [Bacteroidales bacterium]